MVVVGSTDKVAAYILVKTGIQDISSVSPCKLAAGGTLGVGWCRLVHGWRHIHPR
jgi:hypothetical protein